MAHIPAEVLAERIKEAEKLVEVGALYQHYKGGKYKVVSIGIQEWDDEPCVVYEWHDEPKLIFVRPLSNWVEPVDGAPRFKKA